MGNVQPHPRALDVCRGWRECYAKGELVEGRDTMPIYEFRCEHCGAQFEELTSSAGVGHVRCRQCAGRRVTRLLSVFAVGAGDPAQPAESGPCGACGAPQRGMCAAD